MLSASQAFIIFIPQKEPCEVGTIIFPIVEIWKLKRYVISMVIWLI